MILTKSIVSGNIDNGRRGIGRYQLLLTNAELRNPFLQLYRGIEKANLLYRADSAHGCLHQRK
ncbi:MAG: hypothetical protein U5M51_13965 [Emticicia sp.]|nr:hypothetical protein [Emticicia sp.]